MLKDYEKAGFSQIRRCWSMTACPAKKCTIFLRLLLTGWRAWAYMNMHLPG